VGRQKLLINRRGKMTNKEVYNISLADASSGLGAVANVCFLREIYSLKVLKDSDTRQSDATFTEILKSIESIAEKILGRFFSKASNHIVFKYDSCICKLSWWLGEGFAYQIASDNKKKADALERRLLKWIPEVKLEDGRIPVTFWTLGKHGPVMRQRKITVPSWEDIISNYPKGIDDGLSELASLRPDKSGQLILFHGTPGTGKSYAIRALIREWGSWCSANYIVDPERFFGDSAEYMISVLLGGDYEEPELPSAARTEPETIKPTWKLYVVEDGDEFLTEDAKSRSGQALSRLLNVVDGMIGQGLRVLVLVTTNEPIEKIHPAIIRPGRCLANINFRKFTIEEAKEWMKEQGYEEEVKDEKTLAELYHKLGYIESLQPEVKKKQVGF